MSDNWGINLVEAASDWVQAVKTLPWEDQPVQFNRICVVCFKLATVGMKVEREEFSVLLAICDSEACAAKAGKDWTEGGYTFKGFEPITAVSVTGADITMQPTTRPNQPEPTST